MEPTTDMRYGRRPLRLGKMSAPVSAAITIAVAAAIAAIAWGAHSARSARPHDVMLLYVGADDCAPCRAWRNGDGAAFLASGKVAGLIYREVRSPHLQDLLSDENWPEELRPYRSRIRRSDGVPLWLVVADKEVVEQEFGTSAWQTRVLPKVSSYLR